MHSKIQISNREIQDALHHIAVQPESGPAIDNDPGTGGGSRINSIGREIDRDSLRADRIMTVEESRDVADATGPPETVRAPIMDIGGRADSE
jgi:hypothetical protein